MPNKLRIYSDGGARGNPGPAAIGILICDEAGNTLKEHHETIGDATNNVAEYMAVITGLKLAHDFHAKEIDYFVDSQLVAHQISGKYKIKAPHIRELFLKVQKFLKYFERVQFTQVPRTHEKIKQADKLVNLALDREGY